MSSVEVHPDTREAGSLKTLETELRHVKERLDSEMKARIRAEKQLDDAHEEKKQAHEERKQSVQVFNKQLDNLAKQLREATLVCNV